MQELQSVALTVSLLMASGMFVWAALLGLWFMGSWPFHRAFKDESQPVAVLQVPVAVCPKCGFRSDTFTAFVERLKQEEGLEEKGQE